MASVQTIRKVHPAANRTARHRPEEALRRDHDELRRTLFEAAQVQRRLCGPRHLRRESIELAAEIFPVRDLSGDFVSVFELGTELVFAIGDIAGKGLAAAMWFTHVLGTLRLHMQSAEDPGAAVQAVNRDLCAAQLAPLTTLFVGRLDPHSGRLSYCNAGHPPALLLRSDGQAEMLREGGPLLGALPGAAFTAGEIVIHSGDTLLAYSDGILESRNPLGVELGTEGLLAALRKSSHGAANATLFSVLAATEDFAGDQPREDDLALVVVYRL